MRFLGWIVFVLGLLIVQEPYFHMARGFFAIVHDFISWLSGGVDNVVASQPPIVVVIIGLMIAILGLAIVRYRHRF